MRLSPRREHRFRKPDPSPDFKRDLLNPGELGGTPAVEMHISCALLGAPGGPGGVRGTETRFLLVSGGRFRCFPSCDSGSHGNDPLPSVVRILHHLRPGIPPYTYT
jgi:hypothetical protein